MKKFTRVLPYYARHKRELIGGGLCIPFSMALDLLIPIVIGKGIDALRTDPANAVLPRYVALVVGLAAVKGCCKYFMRRLITGASRRVESELKGDLFRHLTTLSFSYFNRAKTGDLLSRATQDVEAVRFFTGPGIMYLANSVVALPIAFGILLYINWRLTLLVALPMCAIALAFKRLTPKLYRHSEAIQEDLSEISVLSQENFAGVRVVKGFHREEAEVEKFRRKSAKYRDDSLRLASVWGFVDALTDSAVDLAFLVILAVGGFDLIEGRMSFGDFFVFSSYVILLFWPLIALGWVTGSYNRAVAAMERIDEVFRTAPEIRDPEGAAPGPAIEGEIELRDLTFSYNGTPALSGITLKIRKGETLGVVGRTGAGKTTLASLIPRLFDPPTRSLFVDGRDVTAIPLDRLRRSIGFVPQDNFLFSDTLRENIAFGLPEPEEERVVRAAEAAVIAEEIRAFPARYDQVIGERGVTLSGGQKQRASIARALAIDPRILIFDDCLSAVDPETERELIGNLHRAAAGRTTILIAHRLSVVEAADRIVVLDGGKILEQGTHRELLKVGGWYAQTWKRQQIEQELEVL